MIPAIIHTCLMGGWRLSPLGEMCAASWLRVLPDYQIWVWNDVNVPASAWCQEAIQKRPVNASHWAQWRALYDHGGIFLDNDIEVVRPFDRDHEVFVGRQQSELVECCVNNAVVGAEKGHPFVKLILDRIEKTNPAGWPLVTGPGILTDALIQRGLKASDQDQRLPDPQLGDVMVHARDRYYPWFHTEPAIPTECLSRRTIACHHWEGSWVK